MEQHTEPVSNVLAVFHAHDGFCFLRFVKGDYNGHIEVKLLICRVISQFSVSCQLHQSATLQLDSTPRHLRQKNKE